MKAYETLERLRKLGKVRVSHKRRVKFYNAIGEPGRFLMDRSGNLIRNFDTPNYLSIREFKDLNTYPQHATISTNDGISQCGGYCEIEFTINDETYYSRADCDDSDSYNKHIALEITVGRLLKELGDYV